MGEALALFHVGPGDELADHPCHGAGAQQHGLLGPAGAQKPVGEDMAALMIGRQLHFVDSDKGNALLHRHGFGCTDEVPGR